MVSGGGSGNWELLALRHIFSLYEVMSQIMILLGEIKNNIRTSRLVLVSMNIMVYLVNLSFVNLKVIM